MTLRDGGVPALGAVLYGLSCPAHQGARLAIFRGWILLLTFLAYTCYHMSRKPISVVKTELLNCTESNDTAVAWPVYNTLSSLFRQEEEGNCTSFIDEMNGKPPGEAKRLEGTLDTSYLFSYAAGMFVSGFIAERVDLRYFLSCGMILSGLLTMAFGWAYYLQIHSLAYFIFIQIVCGFMQSTGWPGVVTVVANWFGKGKKGLIFGIWNSHTSIGNIAGSLLAGVFVEDAWGLSFIVPGAIIAGVGVIFFFVLVPRPEAVDIDIGDSHSSDERADSGENLPLLQDSNDEEEAAQSPIREMIRRHFPDAQIEGIISEENSEQSQQEYRVEVAEARVSPRPEHRHEEEDAISLYGALKIPGVVEFSLCLFFAKLVSYTFLYWLPSFIKEAGHHVTPEDAAYLSTLFDIGGILGGILAGILSDCTGKSASTCAIMLVFAIPVLFSYQSYGHTCPLDMKLSNSCYTGNIALLLLAGLLVNGPYALITTAVSADLGTHPSLAGSAKALATVTAIIDGTGSIGAAIGPLIASEIPFELIFFALMLADVCALLLLTRLIYREVVDLCSALRSRSIRIRGRLSS